MIHRKANQNWNTHRIEPYIESYQEVMRMQYDNFRI